MTKLCIVMIGVRCSKSSKKDTIHTIQCLKKLHQKSNVMICSKGEKILLDASTQHRLNAKKLMMGEYDPILWNQARAEEKCADKLLNLYFKKYMTNQKGGL